MKITTRVLAGLLAVFLLFGLAACGKESGATPSSAATGDEAGAVESSQNVNGKRFNMTLSEFTERYNAEKKKNKETDFLTLNNWMLTGDSEKDGNGVMVDYWHYDEQDASFTASVEANAMKILNIGCGTVKSNFSEAADVGSMLERAALMAQIVCGFPADSRKTLKSIFELTSKRKDSLWYKGFVFDFSTDENKTDATKSIILFRVFPVTDELKNEWRLEEFRESD